MAWVKFDLTESWTRRKESGPSAEGVWAWNRLLRAPGCWSLRNIWMMLSDIGFDFWVVLCEARSWIWWSSWFLWEYAVNLWFCDSKSCPWWCSANVGKGLGHEGQYGMLRQEQTKAVLPQCSDVTADGQQCSTAEGPDGRTSQYLSAVSAEGHRMMENSYIYIWEFKSRMGRHSFYLPFKFLSYTKKILWRLKEESFVWNVAWGLQDDVRITCLASVELHLPQGREQPKKPLMVLSNSLSAWCP